MSTSNSPFFSPGALPVQYLPPSPCSFLLRVRQSWCVHISHDQITAVSEVLEVDICYMNYVRIKCCQLMKGKLSWLMVNVFVFDSLSAFFASFNSCVTLNVETFFLVSSSHLHSTIEVARCGKDHGHVTRRHSPPILNSWEITSIYCRQRLKPPPFPHGQLDATSSCCSLWESNMTWCDHCVRWFSQL